MKAKAQGALEYLLLIGGALIVAAVVIALATTIMSQGKVATNNAGTRSIGVLEAGIAMIDGGGAAPAVNLVLPDPGFEIAGLPDWPLIMGAGIFNNRANDSTAGSCVPGP